ncbi:MAG: copper chaperone PCu(A)C [Xanthobacteraceae bacterium]
MRSHTIIGLIAFAFASIVQGAGAHEFPKGSLHIAHPWSRATPQGANVGAGYLVIENRGAAADRFISVSVSAEIAGRAEFHEMAVQDDVMRMRPLPRGVEIAPGMAAKFEPGGLHVMFLDLKRPLEKGERFKATLNFEQAGPVEVEFVVEAMGGAPQHMSH